MVPRPAWLRAAASAALFCVYSTEAEIPLDILQEDVDATASAGLVADDECEEGEGRCAFNALQRQALKATASRGAKDHARGGENTSWWPWHPQPTPPPAPAPAPSDAPCGDLSLPENRACHGTALWAYYHGRWTHNGAIWYANMKKIAGVEYRHATREDFQRFFFCQPVNGRGCGKPPCSCSMPPCDTCTAGAAPRPTPAPLPPAPAPLPPAETDTTTTTTTEPAAPAPAPKKGSTTPCADLSAPNNSACHDTTIWAVQQGKYDPHAAEWYSQMFQITGINFTEATVQDFQRLFFCSPANGQGCGTPPCQCSKPPCDSCFGGAPPRPKRAGCEEDSVGIGCKAPANPMDYKGQAWPTMTFPGAGEKHIFAIGDWGGMDGSLDPVEGRPRIIAYAGGQKAGPSVFPRTRWDLHHRVELCDHSQFVDCYENKGNVSGCVAGCGYVDGVDDQPQILVAKAMEERAATADPAFVLNVGDNFYWGGIEKTCATTPMDEISYTAHHQFDQIYETVYKGSGLEGKAWLSVLGNHDWGGRQFNNGWDQQIAYTWYSTRWVMPAPYYTARAEFPDADFSVDMFMLDSNVQDAHDPPKDSEHNICGSKHNPPDANCGAIGGPESIDTCQDYFKKLWAEQQTWMYKKLAASTADWQIVVTHFPCGHEQSFFRRLHQMGLDLLVTGHRHDQELWDVHKPGNYMGGLNCFVTGGGGGISSEATPNPFNKKDWYGEGQYGFYDITISKYSMKLESVNYDGTVWKSATVRPKSR